MNIVQHEGQTYKVTAEAGKPPALVPIAYSEMEIRDDTMVALYIDDAGRIAIQIQDKKTDTGTELVMGSVSAGLFLSHFLKMAMLMTTSGVGVPAQIMKLDPPVAREFVDRVICHMPVEQRKLMTHRLQEVG